MLKRVIFLIPLYILFSCTNTDVVIDNGDGINLSFLEGLNDDDRYIIKKNKDNYYELYLNRSTNQTIQRITARLLRNTEPVQDFSSGSQPKKIEWKSNLYWWLLKGDTVAQITKTYFNRYTGELTYINLPPLLNWKDILVTTINSSSYSDENTGLVSTVIAPIKKMVGDTMKISVAYDHLITSKEIGSNYFEILGTRTFKDSVYIILK